MYCNVLVFLNPNLRILRADPERGWEHALYMTRNIARDVYRDHKIQNFRTAKKTSRAQLLEMGVGLLQVSQFIAGGLETTRGYKS